MFNTSVCCHMHEEKQSVELTKRSTILLICMTCNTIQYNGNAQQLMVYQQFLLIYFGFVVDFRLQQIINHFLCLPLLTIYKVFLMVPTNNIPMLNSVKISSTTYVLDFEFIFLDQLISSFCSIHMFLFFLALSSSPTKGLFQ